MQLKCNKCSPQEVCDLPELSAQAKKELWQTRVNSPLNAVRLAMYKYKQTHRNSKFIVAHLNPKQGECHQCKAELLNKEYTSCENCNAFNMNWEID